jgi:pimeloyl-ACP methyl ester carboxylesterase
MPKIYYKESGSGFPLILVHGFCETNYIWERFRETLSDEFHVICPDLPGFGQSLLSDIPFQLVDIADQLNEWLLSSGIRRCVVIGHSLGGYITLELVGKHRNLIAGFGLFNSSAFADPQEKKENRNKLIRFIKKEGVRPFITTFVPSLFYPPTAQNFEKEIDYIKKLGNTTSAETVMAYAEAMRDRKDNLDMLKQNSGMALLISGAEDQNVPVQAAREMAKLLKTENAHILPKTAHMSMFEKEAETIDIIRKFVRKMQVRK